MAEHRCMRCGNAAKWWGVGEYSGKHYLICSTCFPGSSLTGKKSINQPPTKEFLGKLAIQELLRNGIR